MQNNNAHSNGSLTLLDGAAEVQVIKSVDGPLHISRRVMHDLDIARAENLHLVTFRALKLLTYFIIIDVENAGTYIKVGRSAAINIMSRKKISLRSKKRVLPLCSSLVLDCNQISG